ncbi:unnamed protein product [Zymoseptoria tritici ST99CH_1E4]|uniref:Uncharacterized protein n=1 Tax=Zymoseptoria tritici ST99CH_1E4 TaxID=1276532 RepID=A0A2H1GCS7_ZYMTR|nr:unnamed protein product [Zymoseptoria tritici ST99CH_1E4]
MTSEKEGSREEQQPFRLFGLPDELWIKIGEMAIDSEDTTDIGEMAQECFDPIYEEEGRQILLRHPAILQTCSALRNELRLRYYRNKVFIAMYSCVGDDWQDGSLWAIGAYLQLIGLEAQQQISTVLWQCFWDHRRGFPSPPDWQSLREWDIEMMLEAKLVQPWRSGEAHEVMWKVTFI